MFCVKYFTHRKHGQVRFSGFFTQIYMEQEVKLSLYLSLQNLYLVVGVSTQLWVATPSGKSLRYLCITEMETGTVIPWLPIAWLEKTSTLVDNFVPLKGWEVEMAVELPLQALHLVVVVVVTGVSTQLWRPLENLRDVLRRRKLVQCYQDRQHLPCGHWIFYICELFDSFIVDSDQ